MTPRADASLLAQIRTLRDEQLEGARRSKLANDNGDSSSWVIMHCQTIFADELTALLEAGQTPETAPPPTMQVLSADQEQWIRAHRDQVRQLIAPAPSVSGHVVVQPNTSAEPFAGLPDKDQPFAGLPEAQQPSNLPRDEIQTLHYQAVSAVKHRPCGRCTCVSEFPTTISRWCNACLIEALLAELQQARHAAASARREGIEACLAARPRFEPGSGWLVKTKARNEALIEYGEAIAALLEPRVSPRPPSGGGQ